MDGCGVLPPNYIREIVFDNQSGADVSVQVSFKSGATETYNIAAGASVNAFKDIQHDTWLAVDEILSFTSTAGGQTVNGNLEAASGVEIRKYVIGEGNNITRQE